MAPITVNFLYLFKFFRQNKAPKSPVPLLLRSNDPPSELDIVRIRDAIAEAENTMKSSKRFSKLSQSPSQGPCVHTQFVEAHKAVLSLYRRLPTELIVDIFLYCHDRSDNPKHNVVPWTLGHICHRWRIIALNIPSLWRDLPPMRLGSLDKQQLKGQLSCLSTLLTRSGNCGLTFFLSKTTTPTLDDDIVSKLFENSERWEKISLVISEIVCAHFSRIKNRLSSLQSFRLLLTRTGNLYVDMFEVAPKLREVFLGSLTWPGIVKLPWNQITSFTEDASRTDHIITVFHSSAECLQKLNFITDQSWALFYATAAIRLTTLPKLTCLALQTPFETGLKFLLDALTVPALQELVLKLFISQSLTREVVNLINRSGCTLRKLTIYTSPSQGIEEILRATPFLTALDINDPQQNLICALTTVKTELTTPEWALLPHLICLTIRIGPTFPALSELDRLARVRCDLAFESAATCDRSHILPLKIFNIASPLLTHNFDQEFDVWAAAQFAQKCFQIFGRVSPRNANMGEPTILKDEKKRLDGELCEISAVNKDSMMSRKGRLVKLTKRIEILIDHLESFDMAPESIIYLYLKRIDFTLDCLLDSQIPFHMKVQFSERVEAMVAKWASVLVATLPSMKWGWQKEGFLTYLSEYNGSSRDIARFAFQRYKNTSVGHRSGRMRKQLPADLDFKKPSTNIWQTET